MLARTALLLALLLGPAFAATAEEPTRPPVRPTAVSPSLRDRLDRLALRLPGDALGHTRRGWGLQDAVKGAAGYTPFPLPQKELIAVLGAGDASGRFGWTGLERDEADCFALHLCRNAGFDTDAALDAVRADAAR